MLKSDVIENKISAIREYLDILERYKQYSVEEITNNVDIRGAVERYLHLATQATIDLAEAFISAKNFRKPTTLSESFYILKDKDVINEELYRKLINMAGFRNVIVHDYRKIDYNLVHNILHKNLEDILEFSQIIQKLYG